MPLKTNLLADRSEVGLWQMTVSPTCNAEVFTERHLPDLGQPEVGLAQSG
jgi:hypothetical protein